MHIFIMGEYERLLLTKEEKSSFSELLQKLKQRGCSVLVCGLVPRSDINCLSARLLDNSNSQTAQTRLFGLIDQDIDSVRRRLKLINADGGGTSVIDTQILTRSANSMASCDAIGPLDITTIINDIDEFETAIHHEISTAASAESSELRVCIDSLSPFLAEYDTTRVESFLDAIDQRAISTGGIIHTILPVKHDSSIVERITPFFDIIIALRSTGEGTVQQRWYVPLSNHRTDWISRESI